jgi:cytidine deaminase
VPTRALDADDLTLIHAARAAAAASYSPYSRFAVGAALRLRGGEIVTGTNVETASYGGTICAERSALVGARSRFGHSLEVRAIAALTTAPGVHSCPPCALCRNMMSELMPANARVIFLSDGAWIAASVAELLPYPFELEATVTGQPVSESRSPLHGQAASPSNGRP